MKASRQGAKTDFRKLQLRAGTARAPLASWREGRIHLRGVADTLKWSRMTDRVLLPRKLIVFGVVLPLAVVVGYLLSSPDLTSLVMIGLYLFVLSTPLFLRWHHPILVASWNLSMIVFFLP